MMPRQKPVTPARKLYLSFLSLSDMTSFESVSTIVFLALLQGKSVKIEVSNKKNSESMKKIPPESN